MAIIISPSMLLRSAARYASEGPGSASSGLVGQDRLNIYEQSQSSIEVKQRPADDTPSTPGKEVHIYNLYEELSMPLSDIIEIGRLGLEGKLENVQEKIDGQYVAFTVRDNELRFFTKMDLDSELKRDRILQKIIAGGDKGGMTRDAIQTRYADKLSVREGFTIAYDALEPIALQFQDSLFRNGEVVVVTGLLVSANPNTIMYVKDGFKFISPVSLTDEPVNQQLYDSFVKEGQQATTDAFGMDVVPTARLMKGLEEDDAQIEQLEIDLETIITDVNLSVERNTVGDYVKVRIEKLLQANYSFIPESMISDVANRFMTGKGSVALRLKKLVSSEDYQRFRELDKVKPRVVQEAIIPLENIIQRLGVMIIDKLDLALTATNHEELLGFIKDVRAAFESGFDFGLEPGDTTTLESIRVALARLEANEELFKRATEGIVFTYNNKTYKLTGLFTPINKMRGFFGSSMGRQGFGKASLPEKQEPQQVVEILKRVLYNLIREGGNAFKDSQGNIVTSPEKIPRDAGERILADLKDNLLDPLGLEFVPVGSTDCGLAGRPACWEPVDEMGDIDILVNVPEEMVASTEAERATYRDPLDLGIDKNEKRKRRSRQRKIEKGAARETPHKDSLYVSLINHPYLSNSLVPGVPRVIDAADGSRVLVQDRQTGKLYQVDVDVKDPGKSFDDEQWERTGGGKGEAKGLYRNVMLSFIAKHKSEEETSQLGKNVKITHALGRGYKKSVTGEEDVIVVDPDDYLPLLDIHVDKNEVRSFEQLVDYMVENPSEIFNRALAVGSPGVLATGGFDQYVGRSHMGDYNEVAFSYIRSALSQDEGEEMSHEEIVSEASFRHLIKKLLSENKDSAESNFPLVKIVWSDKLKVFSSGKWNLWNERTSAKADGGKDPEGAEKAVAAMENLIYLGEQGYAVASHSDGGILIQGNGINVKLDPDEAVEYIIGIRKGGESDGTALPTVRINHVAGTKPYDLELASTGQALEVKKMSSNKSDKLSKLGSSTGRQFDRHVKLIRPLRTAGQIVQKFIETGFIVDKDGVALVRQINNPPAGFDVEGVAKGVELLDYLFNKIRYSSAPTELPGIMIKIEGGQIPHGMVKRIKSNELLKVQDKGDVFEICKSVLNSTLGDYSPARERKDDKEKGEEVDVTATAGGTEYDGKVSLEYFYQDLIYRLFDSESDDQDIDKELIQSYTRSLVFLAEIYSSLSTINTSQGEDVFDEFISSLKYLGFYGVASQHYYSIPCDVDRLDVYSTTQGFRAVFSMKEIPTTGPSIPDVKIKEPEPEEEIDFEAQTDIDVVDEQPPVSEDEPEDIESTEEEEVEEEEIAESLRRLIRHVL